MATLYAKSGPLAGARIRLPDELVIGRESADVTIEDPELSSRHLVIRVSEKGVEVEDLDSTNGTFVDRRRIEGRTAVGGGALIGLGTTVFELEGVLPVKGRRTSGEIPKTQATRLSRVPQAPVTKLRAIPVENSGSSTTPRA